MKSVLTIRAVLIGLGALSFLTAAGLASFGLLGTQRQLEARERVVLLEEVLRNHNSADAFMDNMRADVLRALQSAIGANKEDAAAIRANLRHHTETLNAAVAENLAVRLAPDIHDSYTRVAGLMAVFIPAAHSAVELALTDPAAGSVNFEHFRNDFSALEQAMDDLRDVLYARTQQVRSEAAQTARLAKQMIMASFAIGATFMILVTTVAIRIAHSITTALATSREDAHHLALHDPLTGLPNRAYLAERLKEALAEAQRHGTMLAMLCLDLDRFKQVNDTLGHPVGDALLCAVASRLRACLRGSDTVARLGGDEFAIIQAPLGRAEDASLLARCVVDALSRPYDLNEHRVVIGASVGIALATVGTTQPDRLLNMADLALYRAKVDGRGTFRSFEPGMDTKLQDRRMFEVDLRQAVAKKEFELHYQPLVDARSNQVTVLEALIRWRHPRQGLVRPNDFVPLAEETGVIGPIGGWVLQQACADAAKWPPELRIAVNISAAQFKGGGLVEAVTHALAASGLASSRLELEITETALLTDTAATLTILRDLRAKGVRIVMDDFGTGYSSLRYLCSFPFDRIKIDQCFIRDIETSTDCKAIVRAVTNLGSNLGITTTAEGVETVAQSDQLRAEGCDQLQGYLFSRPVRAQDVPALLGRDLAIPCAETYVQNEADPEYV